jgi:hypothetical protein
MHSPSNLWFSLLLGLVACGAPAADGVADTAPSDDDTCSNEDCPYDQFCHAGACTPVDGRTFDIGFPDGVDSNASSERFYKVRVSTEDDSCDTDEQEDPVDAFDTTCRWLVDLDQPYLQIRLYEKYVSSWNVGLTQEYVGTDDIVALLRFGADTVEGTTETYENDVELEVVVEPDF